MEGLARVDVLCIDKTGTLTEGRLAVERGRASRRRTLRRRGRVLAALAAADAGTERDAARDRRRAHPTRRTAGRPSDACRSRRPASGARAAFGGARRVVARRAGVVLTRRRGDRSSGSRGAPTRARGWCCSHAPTRARRRRTAADRRPAGARHPGATGSAPDAADTLALLRRAGRRGEGHLGRRTRHGRRRSRRAGPRRRRGPGRRADAAARIRRARRVCSRPTRCSAASRRSRSARWCTALQARGPHRGDDRRRRERRARAEGRRHRRRDGHRAATPRARSRSSCCWIPTSTRCRPSWARDAGCSATSSARRSLYLTKTVYAMLIVARGRRGGLGVPVPAAAPDADRRAHDRDPVVLPRARAEHRTVPAGVRQARAAVRDPDRDPRGDRDVPRLLARDPRAGRHARSRRRPRR